MQADRPELENFGKISPTSCTYFVGVENDKFKVLNGGKPLTGKLVGDPELDRAVRGQRRNRRHDHDDAAPAS